MANTKDTDQQTLDGSYVYDRGIEQDCRSCKAKRSWSLCDQYQRSNKCKLAQKEG